jgi:hypothetical protein
MKTTLKNSKVSLLATLAVGTLSLLAAHLNAQTITVQNFDAPTTINSFATGSLDGFDFFDGASGPSDFLSNPTYGTITNIAAGDSTDSAYSQLTVNGTTFRTGGDYGGSNGTVNLSEDVSSFTIGALVDNGDYGPNNSVLTVSLYGPSGLIESKSFNDSSDPNIVAGTTATNNFYLATISGAQAGDYVSVTGYSFGGITVANAITTPEPGTYALLGLG